MKIGPHSSPAADAAALARANAEAGAAASKAAGQTGASAPAGSTVQISSTAANLLSAATTADFDAAKVARIQQQIAGGTFKPNAEAIADKLIANAQEVLDSVARTGGR
jgi:negative regulator of flagellin synthesis FlgM